MGEYKVIDGHTHALCNQCNEPVLLSEAIHRTGRGGEIYLHRRCWNWLMIKAGLPNLAILLDMPE